MPVKRPLTRILKRFGGIDVLVNNAGITQRSAFVDTDIAVFERVMAVNFFGSLYCTKAAIHSLIQRKGTDHRQRKHRRHRAASGSNRIQRQQTCPARTFYIP
jgi:NAD(P)-dependent dehydrogenase (short-subunit alcohol dehydrogenase family)